MYNYITFILVLLGGWSIIKINTFNRVFTSEKIEHHDTNTPHVPLLILDIDIFRNLWIFPEAYQFYLLFFVDKDVLRPKVFMVNAIFVALFDGLKRLLDYVGHIPLSNRISFP